MELINKRDKTIDDIDKSVKALRTLGTQYAKSERDYRVALAKKHLELRQSEYPATISGDLARGDEYVADLKMQRDINEITYKACNESILVNKIKLIHVESEIDREWRS